MDDAVLVRRGERVRQLRADVHHFISGKRSPSQPREQRLARGVLHHDRGTDRRVDDVVDRGDVGMRQPGGGAGFGAEPVERDRGGE